MNDFSTSPFELVYKAQPDRVIRGRLVLPSLSTPAPYVLLIHGHRSFMDWAFFPELASRLAQIGIASVAFNMSGSGLGPDLLSFSEIEAFAKNTYSKELEDIERVRTEIDSGKFVGLDRSRGALFGHSRGGGMGLLHAAQRGDYRTLCLWAPMHRVALFGQESRELFETQGFIDSPLASGQSLRLDRDVIDDAREFAERLDIDSACSQISAPSLLIYGARDRLHAEGGRAALERVLVSPPPKILVIERAGHTFGARHPLSRIPPTLEQALSASLDWFAGHLS